MKSDRVVILVFGLIGLAIAVGVILMSTSGGPGSPILVLGASQRPADHAEMHIWILGQLVYSHPIASIDDFYSYSSFATYILWGAIASVFTLIGVSVGYVISRIACKISRSAPPTPRRG
jgi:hypothetical protein